MQGTQVEREVEQIYNTLFGKYFKNIPITHPYECDGLMEFTTRESKLAKILIEYKWDEDFKSAGGRAKVILQAIFYMKRFEMDGKSLPNIIFIADKNECFLLHSNAVIKYLDTEGINWKTAPSNAYRAYPDLLLAIAQDRDVSPWVYDIDEKFDMREVVGRMGELANNTIRKVHITEHNIENIFAWFEENVWKDKKTSAHDLVGYFVGMLCDSDNHFIHPNKNNILVTPGGQISINGSNYARLISHFDSNLTPEEKKRITAIADRLIEDSSRRRTGDFWTPQVWVDESHRRISSLLGDDWKEKYVVWDPACGTKNLTRDYRFGELYCSTLFQSELDMSKDYNREGEAFQFDFLNDPLEKAPRGLLDALENDKPFVFFLNPPYKHGNGEISGCQNTNIQKEMKKDGVGRSVLSDQFLYRIIKIKQKYNLSNCHIFLYSPLNFMRNYQSRKIREYILNNFYYDGGYLINAGEFMNVSASWGIGFTMWSSGETMDKNVFPIDIMGMIDFEPKVTMKKDLYNLDGAEDLTSYVKYKDNNVKKDTLRLRLGLYPEGITKDINSLGVFVKDANKLNPRDRLQFLQSVRNHGKCSPNIPLTESNIDKGVAAFAAMTLPERDWIVCDDELAAPDESHPDFKQFVMDSYIYSLFKDSYSYQTSTDHDYAGRHWDVNNEFFWMGRDEMKALANEHHNNDVYSDADTDHERYVYKYIQEHKDEFSPDALAVLDAARELVKKSFKWRDLYNQEHPEIQVNHWDAGWYQIKYILKEYMPDDLKAFRKTFKTFESRLRPLVYELGFLRK